MAGATLIDDAALEPEPRRNTRSMASALLAHYIEPLAASAEFSANSGPTIGRPLVIQERARAMAALINTGDEDFENAIGASRHPV
jgi:hypothetical protein